MKHAGADSVGGIWRESSRTASLSSAPKDTSNPPLLSIPAERTFSATPGWANYLGSADFLRRSIPVLIVLLLTFVAVSRTGSMLYQSDTLRQQAETELELLMHGMRARLESNALVSTALDSLALSQIFFNEAAPQLPSDRGYVMALTDPTGRVRAHFPASPDLKGLRLVRLTAGDLTASTASIHKGVRDIMLDGVDPALARYSTISLANSESDAILVVARKTQNIFQTWHQAVKLNVTLFIGITSVLLVVLYAYLAQATRVRSADRLYQETNARFDTALARGYCGLWDWDLARGRIVWSRSMYQMLGLPVRFDALGFGDLVKLMHPDDPDLMQLANQVFENNQTQFDHRFRMLHADGGWTWMRIRAELVRYKGADPHLIGIAVDISEQEALKQKSQDADIRLRDAIENISEAFVLWDSKKRLVMCNSKYQQFFNLPASAVTIGKQYSDVMEQSRKPKTINQIIAEPTSTSSTERNTRTYEAELEDGRWLQISERRTRDGGFVSVGTDITKIKRNQEKLVESERTQIATIADLRNTQQALERQAQQLVEFAEDLNEQKKIADAGNKAKSDFLANISHELRTPLNAIIGFSDIMQSKLFGPMGSDKYEEYATDIHDSGSFLLGVINDVLDMSKIEAGRFQLNPEPVELGPVLNETMRILKMQADDQEIVVDAKIPQELEITADRRAVKQILLNLLSNAVKFTPKGGRIDVTAKKLQDSINIVIRDNGIGIDEKALERLGQPFEQVQHAFTKNHEGSGLGLAIARSLSMLHGGTLQIDSTLGEGTTVSVRLPLVCEKCEQIEDEASDAA